MRLFALASEESKVGGKKGLPRFVLYDLQKFHRRNGRADEDPRASDRILKSEGIGDRDVEHPSNAIDRSQAFKLVDRRNCLLTPPAKTAEASSFRCLLGMIRRVPEAVRLVA